MSDRIKDGASLPLEKRSSVLTATGLIGIHADAALHSQLEQDIYKDCNGGC